MTDQVYSNPNVDAKRKEVYFNPIVDEKREEVYFNPIVDEKREEVYVSAALDAPLAKYLSTFGPLYFSYPKHQQNFALLSTLENA